MISYDFVPISSQKGILFLRHPVCLRSTKKLFKVKSIDFIANR